MKTMGIDLGTTNTVAVVDGEALSIDGAGQTVLPSVVAYPPSGATLVGRVARRRCPIDPKNTIFSAKRVIGRPWISADTKQFCRRYPFDVVETDGAPSFKTRFGVFTPTDIAAQVLGAVCRQAEVDLASIGAVVAVPSTFGESQRDATVAAATQAGLTKISLIHEAVAAAVAYAGAGGADLGTAAIYDFGGGTFDLAIVDCRTTPFTVLGHGGDSYLGGDDIDLMLADWAVEQTLRQHRWDLRSDDAVFSRLVVESERVKVRLCEQERTVISLDQVDPSAPDGVREIAVDRGVLAQFANDVMRRSFIICDEVLRDVGVKASAIDSVLTAGGVTLLPMIREGIAVYFNKPGRADLNPMEVVGLGASLAGELALPV